MVSGHVYFDNSIYSADALGEQLELLLPLLRSHVNWRANCCDSGSTWAQAKVGRSNGALVGL